MADVLRILHISDLHARGSREGESWRRRRVLGEAWDRNLEEFLKDGPVHLVCFTGDAADWGLPEEFACAGEFLSGVLEKLKIDRDRLFIIPGNHDVTRTVEQEAWEAMRTLLSSSQDTLDMARWIGGARTPFGRPADLPKRVMQRLDAYHNWVLTGLGRAELLPGNGQLGYRTTLNLGIGYPVHIIGLNTAWMCGDDSDAGRLWVLDDQIMRLVTDEDGNHLKGLRILLMHHPFDQLADGSKCRRLIAGHVDLVLRGHLHETELETWSDPGRTIRQLAVGSLYEGWRADEWPNSCQLLGIQSDPSGKAVQVELRYRAFSPRGGHWHDDSSLYPEVKGGRFKWTLSSVVNQRKTGEANPFDPWTPAIAPRFVGRSGLLSRLQDAVDEGRSVSLVGDWRIGKTSLLRMCMSRLESSGRTARLLSGEGHEGASVADFVESATGVRAENTPDAAADQLSSWAREVQKSGLPAALLVDEFDALVARFEHRFLERLRGMLDYLCMVVSSRRELDRLYKELGRTSPFHNRLELRWVGLLEPEASEELIARSAGLLPPDAAVMVQEYAGRHPFFIQLFGRKLIDSCRYGESLDDAKDQFLAEGGSRLRELWGTLSERDQKTLKAAIETPQISAAGLRRRGLLTEDGRPFGRLLVEWLKDDS